MSREIMCVSGFNNQVSGKGIDRIKNSTSFMERYIKEMKVHRRPGGDYVSFYEDFEIFILQLLATIHVMVTIECGPRFESCDGQSIDIPCRLRTFEKFPIHCLLLTGNDTKGAANWGAKGFIMMERNKCLIKSVVEVKIVTTPEIRVGDSEILGTPKNQQKYKRRKKVDQDTLLKPKKLQKHKLCKKKQKKVTTTTEPSEINSDDPEALVKPQKPERLKKIVDELSNRLDEMTEIVKKLKKNSDLLEEENNNTPKEKVVDHECYFESEDADFKNRRTIFVLGFDCSFPRDEIKRTLIKHFSSCGEVSRVYIPFHCDTGSPMGFAFISMGNPDKALTLNGSYLDGMRLEVTMATKRSEYYGYTNHRGCQRCGIASAKRLAKRFYDRTRIRIPLGCNNPGDKVDQDALLKPKKLQKHKLRKKKQKKVATTTDHSEIDSDDPKKLKKEKETLNKKVVECFYESKDAFIQHQRTVFVEGFWCSPSRDDIKRALIKHFSPCGKVSRVSIPFHCQTGVPMGFAFINMIEDYDKALTLDGSYLDELRLTVTMAVNRSEYYFFTNRTGCERCGIALSTHMSFVPDN
ncbi:hypothetical protein HID58_030302 [Brassica napus]|uniref:RRM domain-containing protein n=1 Tax=Brassica napus TaxID=3708 RepID=A0ABQ8CFJ5_BRANA|nr:hypothetical protein HID58_030302 [Brassica napus]